MSIIRRNHLMEKLDIEFDSSGDIFAIKTTMSYSLYDDVEDEDEIITRVSLNLWSNLSTGEQTSINTLIKKLFDLGKIQYPEIPSLIKIRNL